MKKIEKFVEAPGFQKLVLSLIVLNAALMGAETSATLMEATGRLLIVAGGVLQALFVTEIGLRILAHWPRPGRFFKDGWNVFDFLIVAFSLLPLAGPFATVARLARVLRVVRITSVSPELRLIVTTMLRSIPSMGHVLLLMGVLLYIYAIMGFHLFSTIDPAHWGNFGRALLTTFQLLTLEGWVEMQAAVMPERPWAWLFFGSYVIINVFVVVNLFVAVVLNNLENVREDQERAVDAERSNAELLGELRRMRQTIDALENRLRDLG